MTRKGGGEGTTTKDCNNTKTNMKERRKTRDKRNQKMLEEEEI